MLLALPEHANTTLTICVAATGPANARPAFSTLRIHRTLRPLRTPDPPAAMGLEYSRSRIADETFLALVAIGRARAVPTSEPIRVRRARITDSILTALCALVTSALSATMSIDSARASVTNPIFWTLKPFTLTGERRAPVVLDRSLGIADLAARADVAVRDTRARNTLRIAPAEVTLRA